MVVVGEPGRPAGSVARSLARGRPSPRPANLRLLPSRRAAPVPREHRGGAGHGVRRRRRRGKRKMAAGKSGGSAGKAIFLEGTFVAPPQGEGVEAGVVVVVVGGTFATPGGPPGRDTQLCAPGGPGTAGVREVDGGPGERAAGAPSSGPPGARARAGRREASRGPGRPATATPEGLDRSPHLLIFNDLFIFFPRWPLSRVRAGCCTRGWLRVRGKFQTEKLGGSRPTPAGRGERRELSFPGLPGWKHPRLAAAPGVQVRPRRSVW